MGKTFYIQWDFDEAKSVFRLLNLIIIHKKLIILKIIKNKDKIFGYFKQFLGINEEININYNYLF